MKILRAQRIAFATIGGLLFIFLVVPILALVLMTEPSDLEAGLSHRLVWPALSLSLWTTTLSVVIILIFGTPLAWTLAHGRGPVARWFETLLQLPIVIPPAVAGLALLLAFGREGLITHIVGPWGGVSLTTLAVIFAEIFVAAPFYVSAATEAFRRVDPEMVKVARTFGASPWRVFSRVAVPVALPGLIAGLAMCWARALGEFGATLMFAGNLEGRTQTLPLAIYAALESDTRVAQALALVLVLVALLILLVVKLVSRNANEVS